VRVAGFGLETEGTPSLASQLPQVRVVHQT
jgi:hypothetical protein